MLKLHSLLRKGESIALIHIRTGKTGLAHCLYTLHVPEYESPWCECGEGKETPRYIIISCELESSRRQVLTESTGRALSFLCLSSDLKWARITTRWFIRTGRIAQFTLAVRLYNKEEEEERVYKGEGG